MDNYKTDNKQVPFFSIIIPTYNRALIIEQTINHVLAQTFRNYEIIIVDDGSNDKTEKILKSIRHPYFSYFKILNHERGAARNFGANKASGKYFNFFDSDDVMFSNHLDVAYNFIVNHKMPELIHLGYKEIDEAGNTILEEKEFGYDLRERLIKTNFLGCNSVFIRRDVFLAHKFNEDRELASSEDWEIWLRLTARYEILSCNKITFAIRNHASRSLFTIKPDDVIRRDDKLIYYLLKDPFFLLTYNRYISIFIADRYTFYSLLLSLAKRRRESLKYLIKALGCTLQVLKRKRFWASLKHLI